MPRTKSDPEKNGLYVLGTVQGRTKREVPKDNPTTEIVTYEIIGENNRRYYVDDFAPETYVDIGERLEVPVYVKTYRKKDGSISYSLNILKEFRPRGVSF